MGTYTRVVSNKPLPINIPGGVEGLKHSATLRSLVNDARISLAVPIENAWQFDDMVTYPRV